MTSKAHDESVDLEDSEEAITPPPNRQFDQSQPENNNLTYTVDDHGLESSHEGGSLDFPTKGRMSKPTAPLQLNESEEKQYGDDSDDEDAEGVPIEGSYDANEFINLPVSTEIKDLFQFITAYRPQTVDVDTNLRPFVLDYIPAVGDIDAFIKIPRPDDVEDNLGLTILDEPSAKQSDATVTKLQLRAIAKTNDVDTTTTVTKKLYRADKQPKEIESWISSISKLHKSKPATSVHYSKPMPDIDTLMQEWPPEFEELLKVTELPTADMDMSLEEYIDVICSILDVPTHKSRIQALHVLFTLYSEFKNSQHFKALADDNQLDNELRDEPVGDTDRLIL